PAVRQLGRELRDPDRRPGPDDHGRPDLLEHLPRALYERPDRARGGSARARGDPLGDGPRSRAPLHPHGRERRVDPRPRPCGRRGHRGHDGDRSRVRDPLVALPHGRYVGEQDRGPVPGRREQHPARLARVPRRDSARDLAAREHRGAGDRPPLLVPADGGKLMAADAGRYTLTLSPRTKRRKAVNLLMQGIATIAALSAVAVLALVIASVAERGAGALSWDFFTKTAATFGESGGGDQHAAARRGLAPGGAGARPREPARGGTRARSKSLADGSGGHPADELGRNPDRNGARGRAGSGRDGAAPVRDVDRGQHGDL